METTGLAELQKIPKRQVRLPLLINPLSYSECSEVFKNDFLKKKKKISVSFSIFYTQRLPLVMLIFSAFYSLS